MNNTPPLDFYCAFHLHQPVGNFGEVISDHIEHVYRPLLKSIAERPNWPVIVHVSGALLEWCEQYDRELIDDLAKLAVDNRVEFLLAGFYEPVLASLPVPDRLTQVSWMQEWLAENMGATGSGLWLTERVWEPDLARDLANAGVKYALVDDRHFLVSGHSDNTLSAIFRTEHDGKYLDLLPIDEKLRYLIPFRPVSEIVSFLRGYREAGRTLAVFADDAEKFGGWPKTHEWVYGSGWLNEFLDSLHELQDQGEIRLVRGEAVLESAPRGGMAYLGNASYREMEQWSLPPELGRDYDHFLSSVGKLNAGSAESVFVRGAHWKHFLVKYPEANRIHKHMLALSKLCRERGDPANVRRAIGRAQSNDPLWHGVFGGLYLPWLREAAWKNLAEAEFELRKDEQLGITIADHDGDGSNELWIHSAETSVVIAPHRGGAVELWQWLDKGENGADALTRRIESYHYAAVSLHDSAKREPQLADGDGDGGAPSIHDIEHETTLAELPVADLDVRSLLQVRIAEGSLTEDTWKNAAYIPVRSFTGTALEATVVSHTDESATVAMSSANYSCTITVNAHGHIVFDICWDNAGIPVDAVCVVELSFAPRAQVIALCSNARLEWRMPVETIARSERGMEHTVQGQAVAFIIPTALRRTSIAVRPK